MRDQHGRFMAGVSGNPGGRPRAALALSAMIEALTPELIGILLEIARDPKQPARARIAAVNSLLDRRYGKAGRAPEWASGAKLPPAWAEVRMDLPPAWAPDAEPEPPGAEGEAEPAPAEAPPVETADAEPGPDAASGEELEETEQPDDEEEEQPDEEADEPQPVTANPRPNPVLRPAVVTPPAHNSRLWRCTKRPRSRFEAPNYEWVAE